MSIVGVSNDGVEANAKFASEQGFSFPLLCDTDLRISMAYGAAKSADAGKAARIAVLIDSSGTVEQYWPSVDARAFPATLIETLADAPAAPTSVSMMVVTVSIVALAAACAAFFLQSRSHGRT